MNKLFIFIFCCCPLFLSAQSNNSDFTSNNHKPGVAGASHNENYVFSIHLFGTNKVACSIEPEKIEKCSFGDGKSKLAIKNNSKFAFAKHRLSEKPTESPTNQIAEINKKMKKIFHSGKSSGKFSNNAGLSLIVGELSNVVEDGSVMPPPYPKVNKFLNSYPHNSLMGYLLGSVFTPSGFSIGLSVPVPYDKAGTYH